MADTVKVEYLYPPNMLDGAWADKQGNRRVMVRMSGTSDGTGETDVIKIQMSDLKTHDGNVPSRTAVERIDWTVFGLTCLLEWDRAPHAEIIRIDAPAENATGHMSWENIGGKVDPGGDDRTGDILLTTTGATSADSYDITICLRLKD